jgi:hypothetical protein
VSPADRVVSLLSQPPKVVDVDRMPAAADAILAALADR